MVQGRRVSLLRVPCCCVQWPPWLDKGGVDLTDFAGILL